MVPQTSYASGNGSIWDEKKKELLIAAAFAMALFCAIAVIVDSDDVDAGDPIIFIDEGIKYQVIEDALDNEVKVIANDYAGEVNIPGKVTHDAVEYTVTTIGHQAFFSIRWKEFSVILPDTLLYIEGGAFKRCEALTSLEIPDSVISIGDYAFEGCTNLVSFTIPKSVLGVGSGVFALDVNLKELTILTDYRIPCPFAIGVKPDAIRVPSALLDEYKDDKLWSYYRDALSAVYIEDGIYWYVSDNELAIERYTSGEMNDYDTGEGHPAPWRSENFRTLNIGNGVTNIGRAAFYDCGSLNIANISGTVSSIGDYAFHSCSNMELAYSPVGHITSIGDRAFFDCIQLRIAPITEGLTHIGEYAFYATMIETVFLPETVSSIGDYAFGSCRHLTSFCVSTDNAYYSSELDVLYNKSKTTLIAYPGERTGDYTIYPASVSTIGKGAFYNCRLSSVTIPKTVSSIEKDAFYTRSSFKLTIESGGTISGTDIGVSLRDKDNNILPTPSVDRIYRGTAGALTEVYVTFSPNGGTSDPEKIAVKANGHLTKSPTDPTCPPHTFREWREKSDGTGNVVLPTDIFMDFKTVYAKYSVTLTGGIEDIHPFTYSGANILVRPVPTGESGPTYWGSLTEYKDYYIAYENNFNAGVATVKVIGKVDFDGVISKDFLIYPATIPYLGALSAENKTYDGTDAATKSSDVSLNLAYVCEADRSYISLVEGTVAFDSAEAGTRKVIGSGYSLILTGSAQGNYTVAQPVGIGKIARANYDMSSVSFSDRHAVFDGTVPSMSVSGVLPTGIDGKQVTVTYLGGYADVGEWEITALFSTTSSNYYVPAPKLATLTITPKDITDADVTLECERIKYDGTVKTVVVKSVVCDGLVVTWDVGGMTSATECGKYIITIAGNGNFTGSCERVWEIAHIHTVTFDLNGHGETYTQDVDHGERAIRPANPKADGFNYLGWCTEKEGTNIWDFGDPVVSDITLYAKWALVEKESVESGKSIEFVIDMPMGRIYSVSVDGKELDMSLYEMKSVDGKTVITLKQDYVKGLSGGDHNVVVDTTEGEIFCSLYVDDKGQVQPDIIKAAVLLSVVIIGAVVVLSAVIIISRRRTSGKQ